MKIKIIYLLVVLIISQATLLAQDKLLEKYLQYVENEQDVDQIAFRVTQMLESPFNINTVSRDALNQLPFLDDNDVDDIIQYREKYGNIYTKNELFFLTKNKIDLLSDFMIIEPVETKISLKKVLKYGKSDLLLRSVYNVNRDILYDSQDPMKRYQGDPIQLLLRYSFVARNRLRINFIAEKDKGEPFFKESNPHGFDFYSASIEWKNANSWLRQIVVGDYKVSFGQGLNIWQGYTTNKGNSITNVIRRETKLADNTGAAEYGFFRGASSIIQVEKVSFTPFVSWKKIDASLDDSGRISSLPKNNGDGLHRTFREIENENTVKEFVTGGNIAYDNNSYHFGYTGYYLYYSSPFIPSLPSNTGIDDQYISTGNQFWSQGVDYKVRLWHKLQLFGEFSLDKEYDMSYIMGFSMPLNFSVKILMNYRDYSAQYYNKLSQPFAETSTSSYVRNERGLFTGVEALLSPSWTLNGYIDKYKFPFFTHNSSYLNTDGLDINVRFDYNNFKWNGFIQVKQESKEKSFNNNKTTTTIRRLRTRAGYSISENWTTTTQVDVNMYKDSAKILPGYSIFQEFVWRKPTSLFSVNGRLMWFKVEHSESEIYLYERNVLYGFNSKTLYKSSGIRGYVNISYEIKKWTFWLRYASTYFTQPSSSFITTYQTQWEQDIYLQARWKF